MKRGKHRLALAGKKIGNFKKIIKLLKDNRKKVIVSKGLSMVEL